MRKSFTFYKSRGPVSALVSVVLSVLVVVTVVEAATTISTNISTDGTLSVTGASTLTGLTSLGNASSTIFSVFNTAYFGATATSSFGSAGALTMGGNVVLNGNYLSGDGGDEGVYVDTSGSIGIGTTTPAGKLVVQGLGSGSAGGVVSYNNWDNFVAQSSDESQIYSGATYRLTSRSSADIDKIWDIAVGASSNTRVGAGNFGIYDLNNNATRFVISSSTGNVGIGTTTPGSKLSVTSGLSVGANYGIAAPSNGLIVEGFAGFGTKTPLNNFAISDGGAGGLEINPSLTIGGATGVRFLSIDRADSDAIKDFYFYNSGGGVTFKADGSVGIGTTGPTVPLQVTVSGSNATSSLEVGKAGQTKGSCLVMYDAVGTVQYVSIHDGAFVISASSCK